MLEKHKLGGGVALKPITTFKMVRCFESTPFVVYFVGGCPTKTRVGSYGMHFVDFNGVALYTRRKHK